MIKKRFDISLGAPKIYARRIYRDKPHRFRTDFMRDRDRILYSKGFRRLSGKTQIFLASFGDHTRTRLTHTLEVAQIARTISKELKLDVDLSEAIALGHDLGHTPFGHVGERALNLILNGCDNFSEIQLRLKNQDKGFKHNLQSVRVAVDLEQYNGLNKDSPGLNLTNYTLFGLRDHSKLYWQNCSYYMNDNQGNEKCLLPLNPTDCNNNSQLKVDFYSRYDKCLKHNNGKWSWSFESFVCKMSDEIAQRHHDLEDGLEAGILTDEEIVSLIDSVFWPFILERNSSVYNFNKMKRAIGKKHFIYEMSRFIVNFLAEELIFISKRNMLNLINTYGIKDNPTFVEVYPDINFPDVTNIINFPLEFTSAHDEFEYYLRNKVLNSYEVQRMDGKAKYIIRRLFKAYLTNPQQLPDKTIMYIYKMFEPDRIIENEVPEILVGELRNHLEKEWHLSNELKVILMRVICDYISGMTDDFAIKEYHKLYS